jgi:predicted homoserine dehydrogenase-like protein
MGRGLVAQMNSMQGMRPAVLVDVTLQKAKNAYQNAGLLEGRHYAAADSVEAGNQLLEAGMFVVSTKSELATNCAAVHCVVDATGAPEAGAKVAMDAINSKKHIVMLNVEADVCIGHILYKRASDAGLVYTGSAGDEPGAVMELYDFSRALGFDVRVIGKGKNNPIDYDATPHSVAEEAWRRGISPRMLCAFKDGTKTMVELTAMANATGFLPDVMGAHGPKATVKDLPDLLSLKSEGRGGILNRYGVVEYIDGIAPGVFVTVTTDSEEVAYQMDYLLMGSGPLWTLYRPYHLGSLETPLSAAKAVIDHEPTIVPIDGLVSECITAAKRDLLAGEIIDGHGGYTTYASIAPIEESDKNRYVPYGLVTDTTKMKRSVKKGALLTLDDVALDTSTLIYKLRKEQDTLYGRQILD